MVCGPDREPGDGFRVFAGPLGSNGMVASPWVPDPSLAGQGVAVKSEFLWAALDCPTYVALLVARGSAENWLLGRLAAGLTAQINPGDRCILVGWPLGEDGRKFYAASALFSSEGELCGISKSTWIALRPS